VLSQLVKGQDGSQLGRAEGACQVWHRGPAPPRRPSHHEEPSPLNWETADAQLDFGLSRRRTSSVPIEERDHAASHPSR
jgi:hypothetical protein